MADPHVALIEQTLARRPEAARQLVALLCPVIRARVVRVLKRAGRLSGRNVRQEVDDLTQEVFAFLFDGGGKALRSWQSERGLSLPNFVGLLAERQVISFLRSGKRNPLKEDPTLTDQGELAGEAADVLEPTVLSRDLLAVLLDRLRETLSPLGMQLFQMVFVEEQTVEEVAEMMKMSADAVYAWRSRLRKVVSGLTAELGMPRAAAGGTRS